MDLEDGGNGGQLLALPPQILEAIVHRAGLHVRLVCKRLLEAHDCNGTFVHHLRTVPGLGRSKLWDGAPAMDIPRRILTAYGTSLQQLTLHIDQLDSKGLEELAALLRSGAVRLANLQQLAILTLDPDPNGPEAGQLAAAVLDAPGACGNLRSLKISSGMLSGWAGLAALTEALIRATQLTQLQCLDLSDHRAQHLYCRHWMLTMMLEDVMERATHLSNLQELLLRGAGYMLPVATVALTSGNFPKLRTLDLVNSERQDGQLRALLEALRSAPHTSALRELRLGRMGYSSDPADGQDIVAALCRDAVPWQPLSALTLLHLEGIALPADSVATLATAVSHAACLQALVTLRLHDADLRGTGGVHLAGCLQHLPALRELDLAHSFVSSEGVIALVTALAGSPHLASSLEVLDLSTCAVDNDEAASLAAALRGGFGAALRHLPLTGMGIGEAGCHELCAALLPSTHLEHLTSLHVSMFHEPDAYHRPTARLVASALQARHLTGLMEVRLQGALGLSGQRASLALVDALAGAAHVSPGLQVLQLSSCGLGDRGMARLCAALAEAAPGRRCRHLEGLRVLLLDSNGISDVGAACLGAVLGAGGAQLARLQRLSLADNDGITGQGVALLGDVLGRARQLQELRVLDLRTQVSKPDLTGFCLQAEAFVAAVRSNRFLPNLWALRLGLWNSQGFPIP